MDYEETAVIVEMEIENFNNLNKFGYSIDSITFYHLRQCQQIFLVIATLLIKLQMPTLTISTMKKML